MEMATITLHHMEPVHSSQGRLFFFMTATFCLMG